MKTATAWELCGDWWWVDKYEVRLPGGRVAYETATATRNDNVCLRRLKEGDTGLYTVRRTVAHDQVLEMVKIGGQP